MNQRSKRCGVTLLELMVSLPSATILIGAIATCITVSMRARSQDDTLFQRTYELADATHRIAMDLQSATAHVSSSATHIEFVVPDRNGDGLPEQMRYEWGGPTGAHSHQILWTYNDQPSAVLFEDIGTFSLQNRLSRVPASLPTHLLSESAVLKSINAFPEGSFREFAISESQSIGQYFIVEVPGSGTKWDLGSIRLMVRAADANLDGVLCVRIMQSDNSKRPVTPILAEVKIEESKLGLDYQWMDIPIAPVSWQAQGTPLYMTLSHGGGTGDVARVQYIENGVGMPPNANLITSNDGGSSWVVSTAIAGLRFFAYGFYDGYNGQRSFLTAVDLKLGSFRNGSKRIETSVRLNVAPEIPQ